MIRIAEIFESISGEVGMFPQGSPTTFVRLAGCNLNCPWCDTARFVSEKSGSLVEVDEVVKEICGKPWNQILITGGEPLIQKEPLQELIFQLRKRSYQIQVETNGSLRIDDVQGVNCWVVDYKGVDSMWGEFYEFNPGVLDHNRVWIKYLVGSPRDLGDAIKMAQKTKIRFSISPIEGKVSYLECLVAILKSKIPIVLNIQIHKKMGVR